MVKPLDRPPRLDGATYELKVDTLTESLFITINHIEIEGETHIHEVFINCFDGTQFTWIPVTSRLVSAVLRREGDNTFIFKELQDMFSIDPFFYKGVKYNSISSLIGYTLEGHNEFLKTRRA